MSQFLNESDSMVEFLRDVVVQKDRRIEELEALVEELKEFKWMYLDLCQ